MVANSIDIVECVEATFRLLQLFCEHHHRGLQDLIREQTTNNQSYNMVSSTLYYLDWHGFSLYISHDNVGTFGQALETLHAHMCAIDISFRDETFPRRKCRTVQQPHAETCAIRPKKWCFFSRTGS